MIRCRIEEKDTKVYGKILKIISNAEEGKIPDRNIKGWKVGGWDEEKSHKK